MIKEIRELNFSGYATLRHATVTQMYMGECTIQGEVYIDGDITPDFSYDWEVEFKGEKYIMPKRKPQATKDNTSLDSVIELTFYHWAQYQMKRHFFFSITANSAGTVMPDKYIVPINLNLGGFCDLLDKILRYYFGEQIRVDLNREWEYAAEPVHIDINYSYLWDVLIKLYELYGVRWHIVRDKDSEAYIIKVGYPTTEISHVFEYGFKGGLLKVERQVQSDEIRNVLLGRGGNKNIPAYYFKRAPRDSPFRSDPDYMPNLQSATMTELRGKTFRDYARGWNAGRGSGGDTSDHTWAYMAGYNDAQAKKCDPVDYVKDDRSIALYGVLMGGLENNEDIYPTIQGVNSADHIPSYFTTDIGRVDETVAVEQIESDDIAEAVKGESILQDAPGCEGTTETLQALYGTYLTIAGEGTFTIPQGQTGSLDVSPKVVSVRNMGTRLNTESPELDIASSVEMKLMEVRVYESGGDGSKQSPVNIPAGTWRYEAEVQIKNILKDKPVKVTVADATPKLTIGTVKDASQYGKWNIWIKNIFASERLDGESDTAFSERIWKPILGDKAGNEAKIVFSDGWLSTSEDYEFTILDYPVPDDTKTLKSADGSTYTSFWRISLGKSTADYDTLGLYVPSKMRNGADGDHFFFVGIDMPHDYVLWAEERLDNYKLDKLRELSDIRPTWVVALDKVRIVQRDFVENGELPEIGETGYTSLLELLEPGASIRLADNRFILNELGAPAAYENLYVQSITYTFNEPTSDDCAMVPDVEIVLSDKYETAANPVATLSGEVSALSKQLGSIANIEQIVRAVCDKLYLRKDGISDRSMSPTEFASLLTSLSFRPGLIGGEGWGFYRDADNAWVLETDRLNVRQEMRVNNLVINQIKAQGGMIVESAAALEITEVIETEDGYVCYFDQKGGSVPNLFVVDDVALCQRFVEDKLSTTPSNALKYYRRYVVGMGINYVVLSYNSNGSGEPEPGDVIVQYGNSRMASRQFVKVRDVINGGYERYLEGLNSLTASGTEYFFVGRQIGDRYGGLPRWYIGNDNSYIHYRQNKLTIRGDLETQSTIGGKSFKEYIKESTEGGTENLYLNSDFLDGLSFWDPKSASKVTTSGDSISIIPGAMGTSSEGFYFPQTRFVDVKAGERFTLSARVKANKSNMPLNYIFLIFETGSNQMLNPASGDAWPIVGTTETLVVWQFTATRAGKASACFGAISSDGTISHVTFTFRQLKWERGYNDNPEWTPSPNEFSYLRAALGERGLTSGGLTLATLLNLGYTKENGEYVVSAGMNGYRQGEDSADIAFWAGGPMGDIAKDGGTTPACVIRHDGTAYLASNVIRFDLDNIAVGDGVLLDKSGLKLLDGSIRRLAISNEAINFDELGAEASTPINISKSGTASAARQYGSSSSRYYLINDFKTEIIVSGTYAKQSVFRATVTLSMPLGVANVYFNPSVVCMVTNRSTGNSIFRSIQTGMRADNGTVTYTFSINTTIEEATSTGFLIELSASREYFGLALDSRSFTTTAKATGAVENKFNNLTLIGNNGLASSWGNARMFVSASGVEMRYSGHGLRLSSAGLQFRTQGDTAWTTLDPAKIKSLLK